MSSDHATTRMSAVVKFPLPKNLVLDFLSSTALKLFRTWTEYSRAFLECGVSGLWPFLLESLCPFEAS